MAQTAKKQLRRKTGTKKPTKREQRSLTRAAKNHAPLANTHNVSKKGTFQPGHTPYMGGQPQAERRISVLLRDIGHEIDPHTRSEKLVRLLRQVYRWALEGQAWAVHFIADRMEGRPAQVVVNQQNNNFGADGQPVSAADLPLEELLRLAEALRVNMPAPRMSPPPAPTITLVQPEGADASSASTRSAAGQ